MVHKIKQCKKTLAKHHFSMVCIALLCSLSLSASEENRALVPAGLNSASSSREGFTQPRSSVDLTPVGPAVTQDFAESNQFSSQEHTVAVEEGVEEGYEILRVSKIVQAGLECSEAKHITSNKALAKRLSAAIEGAEAARERYLDGKEATAKALRKLQEVKAMLKHPSDEADASHK